MVTEQRHVLREAVVKDHVVRALLNNGEVHFYVWAPDEVAGRPVMIVSLDRWRGEEDVLLDTALTRVFCSHGEAVTYMTRWGEVARMECLNCGYSSADSPDAPWFARLPKSALRLADQR